MRLDDLTDRARSVVEYLTERAGPDVGTRVTWDLFNQAGPVSGLADALGLGVALPQHLRKVVDGIVADLDPVADAAQLDRLTNALAHASK